MQIDFNGLRDRFFSLFSNSSQKETVEFLFPGVPYQKKQPQVSKWKNGKEPIPWKILEYVIKNKGVSRNWLLYNVGSREDSQTEDVILATNLKTIRRSMRLDDFWIKLHARHLKVDVWRDEWEQGVDSPTDDEMNYISDVFRIAKEDLLGKVLTESDYAFLTPTREGRREAALELESLGSSHLAPIDEWIENTPPAAASGETGNIRRDMVIQCLEVQELLARVARHLSDDKCARMDPEALEACSKQIRALAGLLESEAKKDRDHHTA